MKRDLYLYLAGALSCYMNDGTFAKNTEWRDKIVCFCEDNDIRYFDPAITFKRELAHEYPAISCVHQNKFYLDKATILIACTNDILRSPGTQWELAYAKEVRRIPVITFGNLPQSPHLVYGNSMQLHNIDDVIEAIMTMYM